jgi:hypothetical protein
MGRYLRLAHLLFLQLLLLLRLQTQDSLSVAKLLPFLSFLEHPTSFSSLKIQRFADLFRRAGLSSMDVLSSPCDHVVLSHEQVSSLPSSLCLTDP